MKKIIFTILMIMSSFLIISNVQAETVSYSCEDGYTRSGTKCTKKYKSTWDDASAMNICTQGGILNNSDNYCYITKDAAQNAEIDENTSYITVDCPDGYKYDGSACYKTYAATFDTVSLEFICNDGDSLLNSSSDTCKSTKQATVTVNKSKAQLEAEAQSSSSSDNSEESTNVGCPLGPDVTKDLSGALKVLKIVAPLLVFGLSVIDIVKAIAKGDASADLKIVWKRFLKRCLYAIILFFLPVLVDVFMQMADVWNSSGTCDLDNPVDNGANQLTTTVASE